MGSFRSKGKQADIWRMEVALRVDGFQKKEEICLVKIGNYQHFYAVRIFFKVILIQELEGHFVFKLFGVCLMNLKILRISYVFDNHIVNVTLVVYSPTVRRKPESN